MIASNSTGPRTMRVLAVNVGTPAPLVDARSGKVTLTGIVKHAVSCASVEVAAANIRGDQQADLKHHGGPDKAVYCYSHDHLPAWRDEIGYPNDKQAPFGENLSVIGVTEVDIHIGDHWQWGDVVLEVAQPRWPCFKLGLHANMHDLPVRLIESARSGWYFRVITTGMAPVLDAQLTLVRRHEPAPTVRQAFQAAKGVVSPNDAIRIAHTSELAEAWRRMILSRYRRTEGVG